MSPPRAAQLVEAGLWLRLSGDVEGARRLFEQALKIDPTNARARQLLDHRAGAALQEAELPFSMPSEAGVSPGPSDHANPFIRHQEPGTSGSPASDGARRQTAPALDLDLGQSVEASILVSETFVESTGAVPRTSAWDSAVEPAISVDIDDPSSGEVMDLVSDDRAPAAAHSSAPEARRQAAALVQGARDLAELDDHSGALDLLVKAQALAPEDSDIGRLRETSERVLQAMFESKIGPLDGRPRVTMKDDEIIWLNLDHRAGFVLAQIDGTVTFDDLFSVSGMSRLDTARILAQLVEEGVIAAA